MIPRFLDVPGRAGELSLTRAKAFEASHAYRSGPPERRRVHGHNYVVIATVAGGVDPRTGYVVDIRAIDPLLDDAVRGLDHRRLDVEVAALAGREPSVESLAGLLHEELRAGLSRTAPRARIASVRVEESEDLWADRDGSGRVEVTRAYSFSAAHRVADPRRSDAENAATYGKDANPHPHGHDYRLEVTVAGEPDRRTGLVTDVAALDAAVRDRVLEAFDHRYLNEEVPPFGEVIPTAERIAERIWSLLADAVPGLAKIVIYETPRSAFTYRGPAG